MLLVTISLVFRVPIYNYAPGMHFRKQKLYCFNVGEAEGRGQEAGKAEKVKNIA